MNDRMRKQDFIDGLNDIHHAIKCEGQNYESVWDSEGGRWYHEYVDYTHYELELTSSGDYAGNGSVGKSNYRVLLERYPKLLQEKYMGYSYTILYIDPALLPKTSKFYADLLDDLQSLSNYCLADEDDHSELEMELFGEAWENYLESEIESEIEREIERIVDLASELAITDMIGTADLDAASMLKGLELCDIYHSWDSTRNHPAAELQNDLSYYIRGKDIDDLVEYTILSHLPLLAIVRDLLDSQNEE